MEYILLVLYYTLFIANYRVGCESIFGLVVLVEGAVVHMAYDHVVKDHHHAECSMMRSPELGALS